MKIIVATLVAMLLGLANYSQAQSTASPDRPLPHFFMGGAERLADDPQCNKCECYSIWGMEMRYRCVEPKDPYQACPDDIPKGRCPCSK